MTTLALSTAPVWRRGVSPSLLLGLVLCGVLLVLVAAPLLTVALATVGEGRGLGVWHQVFTGRIAQNFLWSPLANTMVIGVLVALGTIVVGGFLAWLVVLTDVPFRRTIGVFATLPYMIPSFAAAFAWGVVFRNERVGGQVGVLTDLGFAVPDWLAWGMTPTLLVLVAHYYSLAFLLIAAALASVNADLIEAATMTGARPSRILVGITLPVVIPAILSAGSLAFAGAVSNFAAPAILGLPAGMHTLSTRLYGALSTGQPERGYVLAIVLIAVAALVLWASNRVMAGRRSFATISGKGGRNRRFALGNWRWPWLALAGLILALTTLMPLLALLTSSLTVRTGDIFSGFTLHFWIGSSDPAYAQGQPGILRNPETLNAIGMTLAFAASVAVVSMVLGLAIAYAISRLKRHPIGATLNQLAFLPALVPGIAFGAAYIALFGAPIGPFPALYGTFVLLVIAGAAYTLPFTVQSGRAAMEQVAGELEDSARMTGAGFPRRLLAIFLPLTARSLMAGGVLTFVKILRDLSLVVLLFTPATPVLSVLAYRYASEGFLQFGNAITALITVVALASTLLAQRLQGKAEPWLDDNRGEAR
ncbi:ABC transporter permease [Microvirga brassicacearum]|uniref:Iron ABC transporter permease n=1 Tax=Microvirga brassicacearum TaxID=2580413 RepID=A0A5N3PE64_9HYPH|nr:iron ABC transporter permease [Microvirga brassicacearum]KAB0268032.1 iron ABC transporter permease [Microvirga brassicacearum]